MKQVQFDIILFDQCDNLRKLELILNQKAHGECFTFEEWVNVLCFMIGVDGRKNIEKKLESILKSEKLKLNGQYDRHRIRTIM